MRPKSIRINDKQLKRYIELAKSGDTIMQAVRTVKDEFKLSQEHTRQAVRNRLQGFGISFKRGLGGRIKGNNTNSRVESLVENIPAMTIPMETISLGWDDKEQAIYRMMLQARVAQKLAIRVQGQDKRIKELEEEVGRLHKDTRYRQEWDLAKQQGEVKIDFTEHIMLYDPEIIANTAPLLNISNGVFVFN